MTTQLNTQSYSTILQNWAAAVQGACSTLLDFATGSILRAIGQAQTGVVLWLQGLILQLLASTRLATSSGNYVDTFVADFGLTRLAAVAASGTVTFARFTPTNQATVPVGAIIQTNDTTQTFTVIADASQPTYSSSANGYILAAGIASASVTVQANSPGTVGNIAANSLTLLQTGILFIDTVTNALAFTNGVNQETDAAVKTRFVLFLASLFAGTEQAIQQAIEALNQNLQVTIVEQPLSTPQVLIYVDDGSGAIPGSLVTQATTAANGIRAAGVSVGVIAASKLVANVNMTIATAVGFVHATVVGQVALAITAYINALGMSLTGPNPLSYMVLGSVAFDVAGVTDVTNVTLNGGTMDLVGSPGQTIKSGVIAVS